MRCHTHSESEAFAACRNCGKGVCAECAPDREDSFGVVCGERCRERVSTLLSRFDDSEWAFRETRMNQMRVESQLARTARVYKRLAEGNFKGAVLSGVASAAAFVYSGLYASFIGWYFAFGLGVILLVMTFVYHFRSRAFREFYAEEMQVNRLD